MGFEGLTPVTNVNVGAWIAPRLGGFGGRVCCIVPAGFARCARVLHPAADEHGGPASWAQVCELTGRTAHPLMQWRTISTAAQADSHTGASSWPGSDPEVGNLPPVVLADVLEILARFTVDPGDCYDAVWDGWGWLHGGGTFSPITNLMHAGSAPRRHYHGPCPRRCRQGRS